MAALTTKAPDDTYVRTLFLERVAHDLRGPAGVTSGALDEIELALGAEAQKLSALFLMARRGVHRVLRAADRLQRAAELGAGKTDWARAPVDLRVLAEKAARDAEYLEGRRGVRVSVSSTAAPCIVIADAAWLQVAVAEVVANAIRFAKQGAWIETEIRDGNVRITVTDDGEGFSAPPALAMFAPSRGRRGLGLSLPVALEVVTAHGGSLEIGHAPAREPSGASGARVTLVLPLQVLEK
jgi:signal transduction histidine kinase